MRKIGMCTKRWFDSLSLVAQNVEENECRRAHDMAVETYSQSFNKQTPLDEVPSWSLTNLLRYFGRWI
jgi:hypothetical protein